MATAAESQGLSPGFKFNPSVEQLLRFFLLPYLQHQHLLVDGVVFVDDPASAPPWALLHRHGRGSEDEAYFIGPATAGDGQGGRRGQQQVSRTVTGGGGGKWIKQRTEHSGKGKRVLFGGETFGWEEFSLNFHADERCRSGSTGWVMHEFAVVPPRGSRVAATHTACHIAFTGHGQKRKRVPDGYVFVDVQTAAADVPPPSPMLCSSGEPPYSGASHDEHFSDEPPPPPPYANTQEHQRFLPAAEQSDQEQEYCLPEQQNYQDYYVAAAEQSDQDYFYQGMINQEQGCNQQDYAYQQQQHLFHGDPLATSQQFLDQDREVLFIGHGSGLVVSDNGEPAAAPATEPPVHCVFLEPLMREPPENVYVDGAGESAMASAGSPGGAPLQQALATPQQFLDQEQAQAPAPAGLNDGGAVISNNNGDGEHAAAPAAQPPARYYNGPVPAVDSVFLDKMREYLMADAKGLCRIPVEDAPTNGDHAVAPVPAVDEPLAAQQGSAPPPPVPPDTAELERVVGHLLMEVEKIIKVAAAGGYGGSSDKPLSNFDKAQNHILAKLMAVFNQVAES